MKNITILALLILCSKISFAQKVPFEKFEESSVFISKTELAADGLTYNDGSTFFQISFPKSSFKISYHNQLATKAIYKKSNGKELLYLTENIDMSKALGMYHIEISKDIIVLRLYFPEGHLITKLIDNGIVKKTINNDFLEFYLNNNNRTNGHTVFNVVYDLCTILKIEKGLITKEIVDNEHKDWGTISNEMYIKTYPKSLKTMQAKAYVKQDEERLRLKKIEDKRIRIIQVEKDRIEEEKRRVQFEIDEKERKKIKRYTGGGFGYYAGINSLVGFSFSGVKYGFGYGLDVRVSDYFISTKTIGYKEGFLDSSVSGTNKTLASGAGLLQINHVIIYPIYIYVGAGYGFREEVLINNELESKFTMSEQEGLETEGGLMIKTGNLGALRAGISYNSFKLPEYTFGYVFFF